VRARHQTLATRKQSARNLQLGAALPHARGGNPRTPPMGNDPNKPQDDDNKPKPNPNPQPNQPR